MKILCLHGSGLNGDIMQKQMAGIIDSLDPDYEFIFIEGEIERKAAPGVPAGLPGPFYGYFEEWTGSSIRSVCDLIDAVLEEEGPFDGFIGFSQGAAIGVSYVLDKEINNTDEDCPFRWMVLFSSSIAPSLDDQLYDFEFELHDALRKKEQEEELEKEMVGTYNGGQKQEYTVGLPLEANKWVRTVTNHEVFLEDRAAREALADDYLALSRAFTIHAENQGKEGVAALFDEGSKSRRAMDVPRFYHPGMTTERLPIPSIHCVGKKDMRESLEQSEVIRKLCEERDLMYLEHPTGHDIPRDTISVQAVVKSLQRVIENCKWKAQKPIC